MQYTQLTTTDLPAEGELVHTKIDDAHGCRNKAMLYRQGGLWFIPDGSMYVYYRPTHWAPATPEEKRIILEGQLAPLETQAQAIKAKLAAI